MTWKTRALLAASLSITCLGCSDGGTPGEPTPIPAAPVQFSLIGQVHDTVLRPLVDVRIDVLDGPRANTFAITNNFGSFELPGVFEDAVTIRATKDGYEPFTTRYVTRFPGRQNLSMFLQLSAPPTDISGNYTLTFTADPSCGTLPDAARTRTYAATITPALNHPIPNQFGGVLIGAEFLVSVAGDRFGAGVAATDARFSFGYPYDDGSQIVEQLAPLTYLAIWGSSLLSVGGPTISGSFDGAFEYCESPTPAVPVGNIYRCPVQSLRCTSKTIVSFSSGTRESIGQAAGQRLDFCRQQRAKLILRWRVCPSVRQPTPVPTTLRPPSTWLCGLFPSRRKR